MSTSPDPSRAPSKDEATRALDERCGGLLSAQHASERLEKVQAWLASAPSEDDLAEVFRVLSHRDRGAAKPIKAALDLRRREHQQDALQATWEASGRALLAQHPLRVADVLAWQRDSARAGAPLSREPLAGVRAQLAERLGAVEDLQRRVQVEHEATLLLVQRIELQSTRPWQEALASEAALKVDQQSWESRLQALRVDAAWGDLEPRHVKQIEDVATQLRVVWEAFGLALAQAQAASEDANLPLPAVPVWAEQLRRLREAHAAPVPPIAAGQGSDTGAHAPFDGKALQGALERLGKALEAGQGKAVQGAADGLRQRLASAAGAPESTLAPAHALLAQADELLRWQRWGAEQKREALIEQAQALVPAEGAQTPPPREVQESLRQLRAAWKEADQGGAVNAAQWKRFDTLCNQAHAQVEVWLQARRERMEQAKGEHQAVIDAALALTQADAEASWDAEALQARRQALRELETQWRSAGHLPDKLFGKLQAKWKQALEQARAPMDAAQEEAVQRRRQLIEQAQTLSERVPLPLAEIKALQTSWQAEAQGSHLDRRLEQRLWDAFRKPLDAAFQRHHAQREQGREQASEHDRTVLEAAQAVQDAVSGADAGAIRQAMQHLEQLARAPQPGAGQGAPGDAPSTRATPPAAPPHGAAPAVVAVRGDDRPGATARPARDERGTGAQRAGPQRHGAPSARGERDRSPSRFASEPAGPRLGRQAFQALREARDQAERALREMQQRAHGEVVESVLQAWLARDAQALPTAKELGRQVTASARQAWQHSLQQAASERPLEELLLSLELAADVPSPPASQAARRALQLQWLTRRQQTPAQQWPTWVAEVLGAAHDATMARRLQSVLKALLRG